MKIVENNKVLLRYLFIIVAMLIALGSLVISHYFVKDLAKEERNKMEIWAEATKEAANSAENPNMGLVLRVLSSNTSIPVILHDKKENLYISINIELPETEEQEFLRKKADKFAKSHEPIIIEVEDFDQYIYYDDSYTLKRLQLYPYIQVAVLLIFMLTAFFALFTTMKMEQDRLWVGLSKETAHQLGTPISSLLAWIEYLKLKEADQSILIDMEKDVDRLQMITDRFSKIGSAPALEEKDITEIVRQTITYLEKRISRKVIFELQLSNIALYADVSEPLLSWVIENLTKNAVDAMGGQGKITFSLYEKGKIISLDIKDTGKGIPKSKFNTIFNPGYTTKTRGWGLGLSLAKRIIDSYHKGKIYVKSSEIDTGTTFCIELKKAK
ncbi:two-component system, sporulation sensor kinase D [Dysgonomonas sp. PFB1-18]|uniref:sensor histidine kinase n=1 Tax=unclassified Dysgonomonas TaxID=2630389 RepID=UPI002475011D|nr:MULTISPECIES: HAMP domain-containing sensor histidine kinase [unclassified Dysgonomonas]MDH6310702.1 two-component system, sporulation sensor kinase D [Dysgonomonas sp. PF1-14]MDH6340553.1 two-component system, sporulation sensor kinase D [Dysgonomonas sp. PF1-16]MDH6382191.1 two-component system, sporulation sensor kinase D [Dysgonomonas sp. PFB1-18]MDH6399534.1 two-component system, sporulation sensor kinase D [Dysgonomonas sp. PF1-23]